MEAWLSLSKCTLANKPHLISAPVCTKQVCFGIKYLGHQSERMTHWAPWMFGKVNPSLWFPLQGSQTLVWQQLNRSQHISDADQQPLSWVIIQNVVNSQKSGTWEALLENNVQSRLSVWQDAVKVTLDVSGTVLRSSPAELDQFWTRTSSAGVRLLWDTSLCNYCFPDKPGNKAWSQAAVGTFGIDLTTHGLQHVSWVCVCWVHQ